MRAHIYIVPWLLSYFAVNCAPVADEEPKLEYPGIGVELEVRKFKLKNDKPEAKNTRDEKIIAKVKGATLIPVGKGTPSMMCSPYWDLTAEHGGGEPNTGISDLTWEWIINGQTLKMKKSNDPKEDLVLPAIWKDITEKLVSLRYLDEQRDTYLLSIRKHTTQRKATSF